MKTRVLIIEPSKVIVAGLMSLLHDQMRFKLMTPLSSLDTLTERLITDQPDVVIINPTLCASPSQLHLPAATATVALVYQYVEPAVLRHYDATIDIRDSQPTIIETIAEAASSQHAEQRSGNNYDLTKRETMVLVKVAMGLTNKEIADQLNVSVHTVMSHRKNIMSKTGIKSVAGLTVYAMLNNLIDENTVI